MWSIAINYAVVFQLTICILLEDLLTHDTDDSDAATISSVHVVRLRNPSNGCATHYICHPTAGRCYDLVRYTEPNRTWLLADRITLDGTIFMTTLVDPLFLLLPYLLTGCGADKFVPIEQVLVDERCPDVGRLAEMLPTSQLLLVCDQRGPPELRAVRYNEEKALNWLAFKCDRYARVLRERNVQIEAGTAKSQTYVKSDREMGVDATANARLSLAISLVCEHLPKELHEKLLKRVGAERAVKGTPSHKRLASGEAEKRPGWEKKAREGGSTSSAGSGDSPASTPQPAAEKRETAKEKAMAKAAQGTRGILSFFKRK